MSKTQRKEMERKNCDPTDMCAAAATITSHRKKSSKQQPRWQHNKHHESEMRPTWLSTSSTNGHRERKNSRYDVRGTMLQPQPVQRPRQIARRFGRCGLERAHHGCVHDRVAKHMTTCRAVGRQQLVKRFGARLSPIRSKQAHTHTDAATHKHRLPHITVHNKKSYGDT